MEAKLETKKIDDILPGTYIVEIAEQTGKTKLAGAGWVSSQAVIDKFKAKGITAVVVDPSKFRGKGHTAIHRQAFFKEEIAKARAVFDKSKEISKKVFEDAQNGKDIDMEPIREVTEEAIDSVFENPDSLACVVNIRNKDEYLLEHSVSVSVLITIFARHLGVPKEIIKELSIGGFLHDVGKIKIPPQILDKPGRLTDDEFAIMKTHVNHSIDIIEETSGIPQLSLDIAAQHHEKLNGMGYPFQLNAEKISQYGRMITICDVFDALCANRCYKKGLPQGKAFSILRQMAKQGDLDAKLVDEFIRCMGVYPVGALVVLSSNHLALVKGKTPGDPVNPKVQVFFDTENNDFEQSSHKDLAKHPDEEIVRCARPEEYNLDMGEIMDYLEREA